MAAPIENVNENLLNTILNSYASNRITTKHILSLFKTNHPLSSIGKSSSVQELTKHIHGCLSKTEQRIEGLLLLSALVNQCSTDVYQQNAITWLKLLSQILNSHCSLPVYAASCHVLEEVVQFSKTFSEVSREITTVIIPQMLPILLKSPEKVIGPAVSCINQLIKVYPGPVGPFRNKIETLILEQLDLSTQIEAVHRCYALLSRCGLGGSGGLKYSEPWCFQLEQLLGSLTLTIGEMYDGLQFESAGHEINHNCLKLSPIALDGTDRINSLVARWKILSNCLCYLLSEEVPLVVKVPSDVILQLVYRCLSLDVASLLQKPTAERSLLAANIPDIHSNALSILKQLILLCKRNLVPQCRDVIGVLCQELVWSQTSNTGNYKQYGALRQNVYDVLTTWMKIQDGCSGIALEQTTIIKQVLEDCSPSTESVQLTAMHGAKTDGTSKKNQRKRKGYQEISQGIGTQRKTNICVDSGLVTAALDVLYWIVTTASSQMSSEKLQEVIDFTVQTVILVQDNESFPGPYSSVQCRKGLYRVLQACVLSKHPRVPPPTHCALQLFSNGTLDKCLEISSFCIEACRFCESLVHPRAPCLNGPYICVNPVAIGSNGVTCPAKDSGNIAYEVNDVPNVGLSDQTVETTNLIDRKRKAENTLASTREGSIDTKIKRPNVKESINETDIEVQRKSENVMKCKGSATSGTRIIDNSKGSDLNIVNKRTLPDESKVGGIGSIDGSVAEEVASEDEAPSTDVVTNKLENIDADKPNGTVKGGAGGDENSEDKFQAKNLSKDYSTPTGAEAQDTDKDVLNMMSTFVDAGPDSD